MEYECKTYCTLARIQIDNFSKIMKQYKSVKTHMVKKLFENPFDIDRNYFCLQIREHVTYLKYSLESQLKTLFYQSGQLMLDRG